MEQPKAVLFCRLVVMLYGKIFRMFLIVSLLGMEFKQFLQVWLTLPCQILDRGRQFVFRLLSYNAWVPVLLATVDLLRDLCLR